jgi:hypothetical protein
MPDSSRIGIECLDCGFVRGYIRQRRRCQRCDSSNIQKFDYDAREAEWREKVANNPATLSEGEVVAFVNNWLIQNHPKKSESSLTPESFEAKCGWERINSATWNGEYWGFPEGKFYETTRSVDRDWPLECFKVATPARRPNPRGIGIRLLTALLYAFICFVIGELVAIIVMVVKGGTIPPEWYLLLLIFILFGGYKGFTKVPKK